MLFRTSIYEQQWSDFVASDVSRMVAVIGNTAISRLAFTCRRKNVGGSLRACDAV
jgi:hypothetical protein